MKAIEAIVLSLIVSLTTIGFCFAQADNVPITYGIYRTVHSKVPGEDRTRQVINAVCRNRQPQRPPDRLACAHRRRMDGSDKFSSWSKLTERRPLPGGVRCRTTMRILS
jgi:hypothetical protein